VHQIYIPRRMIMIYSAERSRSEYVEQVLADISSYYGYNDFLADKLFQLFPVEEVLVRLSNFTFSELFLPGHRIFRSQ
jgi:25S rRNA (cytosine2870-C5)-methyltransferase